MRKLAGGEIAPQLGIRRPARIAELSWPWRTCPGFRRATYEVEVCEVARAYEFRHAT